MQELVRVYTQILKYRAQVDIFFCFDAVIHSVYYDLSVIPFLAVGIAFKAW